MTNTKHTPGPWFQHRRYVSDKQSFAIEDNGTRVGETPNFIIDAEIEANAHLIAAAPELLEALELAKAHMENPYPAGDDLSHILARAEAAIAKARGQSC